MSIRDHFHVPEAYFLSHSVGCLPKQVEQSWKVDFLEPWQTGGGKAWDNWLDTLETFRGHVGLLLGTASANICPQTNVSSALTKLLYSLPKRSGKNVIVLSEQDFPTIGFVFTQAQNAGFTLRFVEGNITDPSRWDDAIGDDVALVHITHAVSNSSHILPVKKICDLARQYNAVSVVDIAQSVGIVPINLPDWHPDFVTGTHVKFLCGGPGACFLYAAPHMIETCQPLDVGWFSHENPFEMDIHHFQLASDAMRFFGGTPSPAPFITANAAHKVWQKLGLETVQAQAQAHMTRLLATLSDDVLVSPRNTPRGGTVVVNPADRAKLRVLLDAASIFYDERAEGFRFSVHGYTNDADIDKLIDALNHG